MTFPNWRDKPSLRKTIFVVGNLSAILIVLLAFVLPIHALFSDRDLHIANQRALLAKMKSVVAQELTIQAVDRATTEQFKRGEFVVGSNDGVINADIQTRLKAQAVQSGAHLRSVQALAPRSGDGIRYLGSQLEIQGTLQAIQRTIYAIETGTPYHLITAAVIRPSQSQGRNTSTEPVIEARLEIFVGVQLDGPKP